MQWILDVPVCIKEIELVVKDMKNRCLGPVSFTAKFYQLFKEKNNTRSTQSFQKTEGEEMFTCAFELASMILLHKLEKDYKKTTDGTGHGGPRQLFQHSGG